MSNEELIAQLSAIHFTDIDAFYRSVITQMSAEAIDELEAVIDKYSDINTSSYYKGFEDGKFDERFGEKDDEGE